MHGRLKVRTSEEEKERKKKEQVLKVKAYRAAMAKIQTKRTQQQLDDEMLQLTAQILLRNPDVSTLWNIRRECITCKSKELAEDIEKLQAVYDAELYFTEQCLMVNTKSYGGWHQRCWSLENSPQPNWERELQLCDKYLKIDERNFHTWDYRRYIAAKAGVEKKQELDFCTEKIKTNFSNYSSWHYRSQLLPVLYPYEGTAIPKRPMSEPQLKEELEMVLTAAFTDPNDSSAWFYQRWLLGSSEFDVCAFRFDEKHAVIAFTKPINAANMKVTLCNDQVVNMPIEDWRAANGTNISDVWTAQTGSEFAKILNTDCVNFVNINIAGTIDKRLPLKLYNSSNYYFNPPNRTSAYTPAVLEELQSQLESCNSLLEYEPDSKWTLLTAALLMRAVDSQKYHEQSLSYIEKLQTVDFLREGYYKDLATKWTLERLLMDWYNSEHIPSKFDLHNQEQLTSIDFTQYFCIADEVVLPVALSENKSVIKKIKTFSTVSEL